MFDILPSGNYFLYVSSRAPFVREIQTRKVVVIQGKNLLGVDFNIEEGGIIGGIVYQSDGITPAQNIEILLRTDEGGFGSSITKINGEYTISELPFSENTTLNIFPLGFPMVTVYDSIIRTNKVKDINLILPTSAPINLKGKIVLSSTSGPISDAIIVLKGEKGTSVTESNDFGEYFFRGMPSGIYTLFIGTTGFEPIEQNNINLSDITTILDFSLFPITTIKGTQFLSPSSLNNKIQSADVEACKKKCEEDYKECIRSADRDFWTCIGIITGAGIICIALVYYGCSFSGPLYSLCVAAGIDRC